MNELKLTKSQYASLVMFCDWLKHNPSPCYSCSEDRIPFVNDPCSGCDKRSIWNTKSGEKYDELGELFNVPEIRSFLSDFNLNVECIHKINTLSKIKDDSEKSVSKFFDNVCICE